MTITPHFSSQQLDSMKNNFINVGDTKSYVDYLSYGDGNDALMYSLFMANKYNDNIAQYYVYVLLNGFFENMGIKMDSVTNDIAIAYLQKSVAQGNPDAQFEMSRLLLYGIGVQQDTIAAKEYIYKIFEKPKADKIWFIKRRDYIKSLHQ